MDVDAVVADLSPADRQRLLERLLDEPPDGEDEVETRLRRLESMVGAGRGRGPGWGRRSRGGAGVSAEPGPWGHHHCHCSHCGC